MREASISKTAIGTDIHAFVLLSRFRPGVSAEASEIFYEKIFFVFISDDGMCRFCCPDHGATEENSCVCNR